MFNLTKITFALYALYTTFFPSIILASGGGSGVDHAILNQSLLFIVILLIAAKLGGIIEKSGMPSVLGELGAGIALAALGYFGWHVIDEMKTSTILAFLAQFGAIILLFEIGLESNLNKILSVGVNALVVALIGVITPFLLGYLAVGPVLFPDSNATTHLFIGASLVATSVGITAVVLKSLGLSNTRAYQTILGAAIIDDILGLIILAVVSSLASGHSVTPAFVGIMTLKSIGFLVLSIAFGQLFAQPLSRFFAAIHTGTGMKLSVALGFAFSYAYVATLFGLEPIVGAFAAGLVLDAVHFNFFDKPTIIASLESLITKTKKLKGELTALSHHHIHTHIEDMTHSISILFVPIFFAYTGLQLDFGVLLDPTLYGYVLIIGIFAMLAKLVAGLGSPGKLSEKILVGTSMIPRGEVGLIFASVGKALGVLDDRIFAIIVLVAIMTTFVSAPLIKIAGNRFRQDK